MSYKVDFAFIWVTHFAVSSVAERVSAGSSEMTEKGGGIKVSEVFCWIVFVFQRQ